MFMFLYLILNNFISSELKYLIWNILALKSLLDSGWLFNENLKSLNREGGDSVLKMSLIKLGPLCFTSHATQPFFFYLTLMKYFSSISIYFLLTIILLLNYLFFFTAFILNWNIVGLNWKESGLNYFIYTEHSWKD